MIPRSVNVFVSRNIQNHNAWRTLSKSRKFVHAFEAQPRNVLGEACPLFFVALMTHNLLLCVFSWLFSGWKIALFGNSCTVSRKLVASPYGIANARVVSWEIGDNGFGVDGRE